MAVVALVALDFGVVQALLVTATSSPAEAWPLIFGALPMANILAVGLRIRYRARAARPFLFGFEVFGAIALLGFLYVAILLNDLLQFYLFTSFSPFANFVSEPISVGSLLIIISFELLLFGLPQLVFALLGGFLFRKFS